MGAIILGAFLWTLLFLYNKSQAKPVVFKTEKPLVTDIVKKTVATGAIVPRKEIAIKPRVSGVVDELVIEPGQIVKKGDLIAKIKIIPNVVSLNSAESRVKAARVRLNNAQTELERFKGLFAQQLISETELNQRKLDFELTQQEVNAASSNLQLIKKGAARGSGKVSNQVRSTVDGMVLEVPVEEGVSVIESNTFNEGTTIATVANMEDLIFKGTVDESEVGKIKTGMALDIKIGALDTKRFEGTLEYVAPKGTQIEGAIQFEIRAAIKPPKDVFIRANYSANADIVLDKREKVLAIREAVLQFDDEKKPFVEVEDGPQNFIRRDLKVGLSDGINIEILEGLDENAKLKRPQ
jgi:HlyD family secretion protein